MRRASSTSVGVVRRLDVLDEVDAGCRGAREARQTGGPVFHQVATLIASQRRQRLDELVVVLERAHRRREVEPVRLARRACTAAASWPRSTQAVEVLEDVAVAAADAGVLGHVDDAQRAVVGVRTSRLVEARSPQRCQNRSLGGQLALALLRPPRLTTPGGCSVGARRVDDPQPGLPGAQAPVDVLVGHPVGLVEQRRCASMRRALDVHAGAGRRRAPGAATLAGP